MNELFTPAMKQYYEMKEQYKDCILFFRMWDFYEMFDNDALIAHKILWIAITSRNKNSKTPTPLAWIPYHAKEKYLPILINAWYKVALAEQISDPKLKWIVKREVIRIITPSTIWLEWDIYEWNNINNFIIWIVENNWFYWISQLNIWTNKWSSWEFNNFWCLKNELYKLSPKEVVLEKNLFWNIELKEILEKKFSLNIYFFQIKEKPKEKLTNHFNIKNLEWFWIENKILAQKASSLLLEYLETNQKSKLDFLKNLSYISYDSYMNLDESTINNLDLIYNFATKSSTVWTLFWVLNNTKTSMWTNLLREQIIKPLNNIEEIKKRQNFIEELTKNKILLDKIRKKLEYVSNLNLILNRLTLNRANPRDLLNLKKSLESIVEIFELIQNEWNEKLKKLIL